ncbi:hypothetical protein C0J52_28368 [Blattella germanica]|nr:hypothetical protein C0J52_28368 [Blattella germanica]
MCLCYRKQSSKLRARSLAWIIQAAAAYPSGSEHKWKVLSGKHSSNVPEDGMKRGCRRGNLEPGRGRKMAATLSTTKPDIAVVFSLNCEVAFLRSLDDEWEFTTIATSELSRDNEHVLTEV